MAEADAELTDYARKTGWISRSIRWMLSLTPAERLEVLRDQIDAIAAIRENVARK